MTRASLAKDPRDVAAMFDDVAGKYDVTNDVLSLGQDRLWRRAVLKAVGATAGERVLDIAAGTGTSSEPFADQGVHVVPADFSLGMLRVGNRRRPDLGFTAADAMRLPFADDSFDAVTMSFGLRNVASVDSALQEFLRVTKPGGRLVVCEFSQPVNAAFRTRLHRVPHALAADDRPPGQQQPRVLRLPRRVDPGVAGAARARDDDQGRRLVRRGLAQPHRRDRRPPPRDEGVSAGPG